MFSIKFRKSKLYYLDQTKLPQKEVWKQCRNISEGFSAIKELKVRGAPLIGVFAAYCVAVYAKNLNLAKDKFIKEIAKSIEELKACRPTAVNLAWALTELKDTLLKNSNKNTAAIRKALLDEAQKIYRQDIELCNRMAEFGIKLIKSGDTILTHCNAGFLATAGEGTALSLIYKANAVYKNIKVYADETRPLLQGARLTAWELSKRKINCTLICDNMAAYLMQKGKIDKILVGADRIAASGDTANKIGTYSVAVAANYHKVPFYVVAPFSTFDLSIPTGSRIPIEERDPQEVRTVLGKIGIAPENIKVFNPAFDVTPAKLITAIVSDRGVIYPPYNKNIKKLLGGI
ncbi:MAG: S-methyl-5-thioribose-1-phosphate isomerase [Candidatus Omnitrophica bacterium]|nr:S-methyl-5-thioribose-1-phosphate isomerase [Candidatus Omnitrophota bacterium]